MEPSVRGYLEKLIDTMTSEEGLEHIFNIFKRFEPLVKSKQDAVFGYIHGLAISTFAINHSLLHQGVEPSDSETNIFTKMFEERSVVIMSKIREFANR